MANSYSYDPSSGQAVPTSQITEAVEPTAQEYQSAQQSQIFKETANFLANGSTEHYAGQDEANLDLEMELASVQQQLHRADANGLSHMEKLKLESMANVLAQRLVGDPSSSTSTEAQRQGTPKADPTEMNNEITDRFPGIQDTLQYAADHLPESTAIEWNEQLESDDPEARLLAARALTNFEKYRDQFVTADDGYQNFTEHTVSELTELVGAEYADAITTINAALVEGHTTAPKVMQMVAKDPGLFASIQKAAQQNIIKIGF